MNTYREREKLESVLRGLATGIRFIEDLNGILSSVFISLALILAVMSLITGGALLQALPWTLWIWAGALAVGVEATLVSAFDRAHQSWIERRRLVACAWAVLGVMLAIVGFVAVAAFTIQQSLHITEAEALRMMGLSPLGFDIGRSLITVLLACIAGLARPRKQVVTHEDRKRELREAIEIEPLKRQLESLRAGGKAKRPTNDRPPTGPGTPTIKSATGTEQATTDGVRLLPSVNAGTVRRAARAKLTLRDKVWRALDADGTLSKSSLARRFRCSESVASKYKSEWLAQTRNVAQ